MTTKQYLVAVAGHVALIGLWSPCKDHALEQPVIRQWCSLAPPSRFPSPHKSYLFPTHKQLSAQTVRSSPQVTK